MLFCFPYSRGRLIVFLSKEANDNLILFMCILQYLFYIELKMLSTYEAFLRRPGCIKLKSTLKVSIGSVGPHCLLIN